jgi:hypothetical protein
MSDITLAVGDGARRMTYGELIPDPEEQAAIADIVALRTEGKSLMAMRARGFSISPRLVANTIARQAQA